MSHLFANWPAPKNIKAFTTKQDENLLSCNNVYGNNNLALHVGDDTKLVLANRRRLMQNYSLPSEPAWLEQTHSSTCVIIEQDHNRNADAAITRNKNQVITIMTGDCLPILLCDKDGQEIAAIHAGWRGLANGIINETIDKMTTIPSNLLAWIGPAICAKCYVVGDDVYNKIMQQNPFLSSGFEYEQDKMHANLSKIADNILHHLGVSSISHSNECTFEKSAQYYSARKSPITGRIATLIWMT